jgi:Mg-chelatase subunit ChlD
VTRFLAAADNTQEVEQLALVSYAHEYTFSGVTAETVTTHQRLTSDSSLIQSAMAPIGDDPIIGGTNISAGISNGIDVLMDAAFARPHAFKVMVLMTDGVWNMGVDPAATAAVAADNNIVVHTITFSAGANQPDMIEVADLTGGRHYHAPNSEELQQAFEDIAYSLPVIITQ